MNDEYDELKLSINSFCVPQWALIDYSIGYLMRKPKQHVTHKNCALTYTIDKDGYYEEQA